MKKTEKKKKNNWFKRSTRIVGMNPITFEEWWRVKINRIQLISIALLFVIVLFIFNYLIFSYTPIGYLLPENIKNRNKQKIEATATRVASLEKRLIAQDKYINNLQKVILGEVSIDSIYTANLDNQIESSTALKVDTTISNAEKQLDQNL